MCDNYQSIKNQAAAEVAKRNPAFATFCNAHPVNGPLSRTTRVSRYQKGKTDLDFTEARDSEWQSHQLGHMQVCISLQTDNHASTPPLSFLQAGCPSCHPTNSVKALKATLCNLNQKLSITGYPTIQLFRGFEKKPLEFTAGRMAEDFLYT